MCPSLKHFGLFICAIGYKYNRKAQTFFIVHVRNMFSFPNKKQKKTFIYEKSRLHTEHRIETKLRYYRTSIDPIPAVDIWFYLPTCLPRHHCYWTSVSFTQVSLSQSCTASSCHTGYFDIWGKRWAESRHYSTVKMLIACFFFIPDLLLSGDIIQTVDSTTNLLGTRGHYGPRRVNHSATVQSSTFI